MASGATGSVIVKGGRGKTRGEGGKKGKEGGEERKGSKMIVNMGGGGWVCTLKIRGRGDGREGKQNDSEYGKGRVSVYF